MNEEDSFAVKLGRMEVKVDQLIELHKDAQQQRDKDHADHETRIRAVERWMYAVPPALLVSIAALILTFIHH